tara:strand:+ start:2801 stop:3301 length:501 start_codon:yes stop_codon:yes gene_type:complete
VGRLAFYLIVVAAVTGSTAGWAFASGAVDWVRSLTLPGWMPPINILAWVWIAKALVMTYALWATERFGKPGWRWIALGVEISLFLGSLAWIVGFLMMCDVTLGFIAVAVSWVISIVAVWAAGKASRLTGLALLPVLAWNCVLLVLTFEIMRLNTGAIGRLSDLNFG